MVFELFAIFFVVFGAGWFVQALKNKNDLQPAMAFVLLK
jgi:hypothetical protein